MKDYDVQGFMNWMSGGTAAAALALFVFVPTLSGIDKSLQTWAVHAFLFSLPPLVSACMVGKEQGLLKIKSSKSNNAAAIFLFIGGISIVVGLTTLCLAIGNYLIISFVASTGLVTIIFFRLRTVKES